MPATEAASPAVADHPAHLPPAPGPPTGPSITVRGRRYPVLLPKVRDPRLHVAAVIITVQVLGQVVLRFDVSIAQIFLAIGTAAVLELLIVARTERVLAWPASAMLTGNGIALILRTPGTEHGDWWSLNGWPIFVACAGFALLSKYAIRVGDRHLFNPSNLGLVVVFLVFGSQRADPQDLWWGPWSPALAVTLAVILVGGITLARRLHLFEVALTFWLTFAAGIAVLAAGGHAITARWHLGPLSGWSYWWIFVFSPEIVIFVFFMITDPRTAPLGRVARRIYAAGVGVLAAVLAAFQHTEYATKVSLLAALTIVCGFRPLLEHRFDDARYADGTNRWFRPGPTGERRLRPTFAGVGLLAVIALASVAVIHVSGTGNRNRPDVSLPSVAAGPGAGSSTAEQASGAPARAVERPAVRLPAGAVPEIAVDDELRDIDAAVPPAEARRIGRDLLENLVIEGRALRRGNEALAATASFGARLADTTRLIADQADPGPVTVPTYRLETGLVVLLRDPVNPQSVPQLGLMARGTKTLVTYAGRRDDTVVDEQDEGFTSVYLLTYVAGHYLIGDELPVDTPMVVGLATLEG